MKYFTISIPIWLGLFLAFIFPYYGMSLSSFGFSVLFILSFLNIFFFDFQRAVKAHQFNWDMAFFMVVGYILLPAIQLILAHWLIDDHSLKLGLLLAVISPVAVVTPQFLRETQRDRAILYILLSTLLYPPICYFYISVLKFENLGIKILPIVKDTLILTLLPLLVSFIFQMLLPALKQKCSGAIMKYASFINMLLIGFLVFIYFGASFAKTNYASLNAATISKLALLALWQDFGTYGFMRLMKFPRAEAVGLSLKNVALSGGVLLVFHPQAVLGCSVVFIAHAFFFTYQNKSIKKESKVPLAS